MSKEHVYSRGFTKAAWKRLPIAEKFAILPSPYALLAILERKPNFGDDHGPKRLAILFLRERNP